MPIYKQKNGTYRVEVNYRDELGRKKTLSKRGKQINSLSIAKLVEAELLFQIKKKKDDPHAEEELTLNDIFYNYIESQKAELRASTLRKTKDNLTTYVLPFLGNSKPKQFTIKQLQEWKEYINNFYSERTKKKLSLQYKNNIYKAFNVILNYAYKIYGIPNNILPRLGRFKDPNSFDVSREKIHFWTYDQFKIFIECVLSDCETCERQKKPNYLRSWAIYVAFNIYYLTGIRRGEGAALKWSDIICENNIYYLDIRKSVDLKYKGADGKLVFTSPKNRFSVRRVPLCKELRRVLREQYNRLKDLPGFTSDYFIIGDITPISNTNLSNARIEFSKAAGVPQIRLHDFRHSFVSILINSDINIKTISALVGHATVDLTWNLYGHLYPENTNDAITCIDKIINNSKADF